MTTTIPINAKANLFCKYGLIKAKKSINKKAIIMKTKVINTIDDGYSNTAEDCFHSSKK